MRSSWGHVICDDGPSMRRPVCKVDHDPEPAAYLAWHDWAEERSKTHKQARCEHCGLYVVWVKR